MPKLLRSGTAIVSPKRVLRSKSSKIKAKAKPTKPTRLAVPASSTPKAKVTAISGSTNGTLLYDLGPLVSGTVLRRPSATIRSPYVADVQLDDDASSVVLGHAPALDVGGLCSPGSKVWMKVRPPGGKTSHSIELVTCTGPETGPTGSALVGAHPRLGEDLAKEVIRRGMLDGVDGSDVKTQVTLGDSRVDFVVPSSSSSSSGLHIIEVKNVVCADYHDSTAPAKINQNHCVVTSSVPLPNYMRSGLFPWGRVGQEFEGEKVVSARAIKHLRNLAALLRASSGVGRDVNECTVLFVLNRGDCAKMRACKEQDPVFAEEMEAARAGGVRVKCFRVRWQPDGKGYFDGWVQVD